MADINAKLKQANDLFNEKKFKEAAVVFAELVEEAPEQYTAQLSLQTAISYFNGLEPKQALPFFEKALEKGDEAIKEQAIGARARCLQALNMGEAALTAYEEALAKDPKGTTVKWAEFASMCNQANQYERALDAAAKGLEHQPDDFAALHNARIVAFFRLNKPVEALEDVQTVLSKKEVKELNPSEQQLFSEVLLQKGQQEVNAGNHSQARNLYNKANELFGSPQSCFLLGILEMKLDKFDEAIKYFEETIQKDASFWRARVALGLLLMRPQYSDYENAIVNLNEAINVSEEANNPNIQFNLGYAYYQTKDKQKAKECLKYVYDNDISNWRSSALFGSIAIEEEDWEKAIEYLKAAIDHSNGEADVTLHYNLAYAYMMMNQFAAAKVGFEKAAEMDPSNENTKALIKRMEKEVAAEEAEKEKQRQEEIQRLEKEKEALRLQEEAKQAAIAAQQEKDRKAKQAKEEQARKQKLEAERVVAEQKEAEKQIKIKKQKAAERRRKRLEELRVLAGAPQEYRARRPSLELIPKGNTNKNAHKYADWFNEKIVKKS